MKRALPRRLLVGGALSLAAGALIVAAASTGGVLGVPTALLLGLIEGLTEYLPVSSTGHLTVAGRVLGVQGAAADAYVIVIQAGAVLAVPLLYRARVGALIGALRGGHEAGRRLLLALLLAFLPAALLGFAVGDLIQRHLFGLGPIAFAWAAGGLVLLVVARRAESGGAVLESLSPGGAFVIGLAQAVALWPGVSRSLVTILAGVAIGLSLPAAVEFSFLLGFLTLGAATGYEGLRHGREIFEAYGVIAPVVGFLAAFGSAVVSVRWMVSYLERSTLAVFGWYRLALAAVAAVLLAGGVV